MRQADGGLRKAEVQRVWILGGVRFLCNRVFDGIDVVVVAVVVVVGVGVWFAK